MISERVPVNQITVQLYVFVHCKLRSDVEYLVLIRCPKFIKFIPNPPNFESKEFD